MHCPTVAELPPPPINKTGWPWTRESAQMPHTMPDGSPLPRVSIVTPSYNQGQFIEETIRSVLLQGYPNLEYIVMDGGSSDESVEIIQKYAPWLTYWVSAPDKGQTDAINRGWQISSGQTVSWLNSDDVLAENSLKIAVTTLLDNPGTEFVHGNVGLIDADSKWLRIGYGQPFSPEAALLRSSNVIRQPGFLMKQTVLQRIGWLDPEMSFCMDFDYWSRMALHNVQTRYINQVLAYFRQHNLTKTSTQYQIRIAEREQILAKVFRSPHLPSSYRNQRKNAEKTLALRAAFLAFRAGDPHLTRHYSWQYLKSAKLWSSPIGLYLLFFSLWGRRGLQTGILLPKLLRWSNYFDRHFY